MKCSKYKILNLEIKGRVTISDMGGQVGGSSLGSTRNVIFIFKRELAS